MDVEPTGVTMIGMCSVRGTECTARATPEPITAVWELPGNRQINVCGACLKEKVERGEWRVRTPPSIPLDLASLDATVRWALLPPNQGTRADLIRFLDERIKEETARGNESPSTGQLRRWLDELKRVDTDQDR